MYRTAIMRGVQTYEFIKMNGWSSFFKETFYHDRRAILFEKDLRETKDQNEMLKLFGVELIEITNDIIQTKKYHYRFKNRHLKAKYYLEKGYSGYAIAKEKEIIGEMWYCTDGRSRGDRAHPDLPWLGLRLSPDHVYAFDLFLVPQERGDNLAGIFQSNALYSLGKKGFVKAFAYVWADNTPALWNTRTITRWKEVGTSRMNRFLINKLR